MIKKVSYIFVGLIVSGVVLFSLIDLIKITQEINRPKDELLNKIVSVQNTEIHILDDANADIDDQKIIEEALIEEPQDERSFDFTISDLSSSLIDEMYGKSYHENNKVSVMDLKVISLYHYNFNGDIDHGKIIVNSDVANEVLEIFEELFDSKYPINKIELVHFYDGDDSLSMSDNNTHAFNFRNISGSNVLSNHAYGLAIDINPLNNPYVKGTYVVPKEATTFLDRSTYQLGMILKDDVCYNAFTKRGWEWGGEWSSLKDYQHFEKKIDGINQ